MVAKFKRIVTWLTINSRYVFNLIRFNKNRLDTGLTCIIFSRDRAMQLDALLRSIELYSLSSFNVIIQYSCSYIHRNSYEKLKKNYIKYEFIEESSFMNTLQSIVQSIQTSCLFFLVDDQVFIRPFNIMEILQKMKKNTFFSLRLGRCIIDFGIYHERLYPIYKVLEGDFLIWKWRENIYQKDWGYQFSVDGTVYRTLDIIRAMMAITFKAPNSFEDNMNKVCFFRKDNVGISYFNPVVINLIINASRHEKAYEHFESGEYTTDDMLKLWERGFSLSLDKIASIPFSATHYIVDDIRTILCEPK